MDELCKIRDVYRLIYEFESRLHAQYGIGLNEGVLICSVCREGKCSSGQIAERLGLSCSNSSKVIASAEKKGLIKRILGAEDRRQMYFNLTTEGKQLLEIIRSASGELYEVLGEIKDTVNN